MADGNLAVVPLHSEPDFKDVDDSDGSNMTGQITIDVAENGWTLTFHQEEEILTKVFLMKGSPDSGPKAMIQEIIDALGITDKVRIQK